ncbi:replication protein RepA [Nocardia jejuensis]|uniref:replication protein RepA n=1 Tax=Nocardia jejuensis TaxID=328049 RepID=UPI001471A522|nr:replication protein RepA [Nocardia jejuensis]
MFTQTSLPYRDPGDVPWWGRRNGDLSLTVQPGVTVGPDGQTRSIGYPYGTMPRLILTFLSTEAVRTKSPEIVLGNSLNEFMGSLGLRSTGGKNGSITRMRAQSERLFKASLSIEYKGDSKRQVGAKLSVASAYNLWWTEGGISDPSDSQASLFTSVVMLSDEFFREVTAHPVPLDMNALKVLGGSALRLDIYAWLTYRMYSVRKQTTVPWELLWLQFGSTAADNRFRRRQFRLDFTRQMAQVLTVYPQAKVDATESGLVLYPSPTHVPPVPMTPELRALARSL